MTKHRQPSYMNDRSIIIEPLSDHTHSLVWLHGLGDSAQGFVDVFTDDRLIELPKGCKVILPTAPIRSVTLNGGMKMTSWYDIMGEKKEGKLDATFFDECFS